MALPILDQEYRRIPAVSVIIPVLNTRMYIEQCLDSLMAQTLQEIEVICVDNGSTDGSYEFLVDYAKAHSNIIVMRHTEGRQGGARNAGIEIAKGDYIGFVDSDDFVLPDMFQKMYNAAQMSNADIAVCNMELYYGNHKRGEQGLPSNLLDSDEPFFIQERPRLLRNLTVWNKIIRHKLIERYAIRFPEGVFHEDQLFAIAALVLAQNIVAVPDSLYFYRRGRPGSVNEYRGVDSMHVFQVMQTVSEFVDNQKLDKPLRLLINEVKALKYLQIYRLTGKAFQREYFSKMKKESKAIELGTAPKVLSPSEQREFQIVLRYGYIHYALFLRLRSTYGWLRTRIVKQGVLGSLPILSHIKERA